MYAFGSWDPFAWVEDYLGEVAGWVKDSLAALSAGVRDSFGRIVDALSSEFQSRYAELVAEIGNAWGVVQDALNPSQIETLLANYTNEVIRDAFAASGLPGVLDLLAVAGAAAPAPTGYKRCYPSADTLVRARLAGRPFPPAVVIPAGVTCPGDSRDTPATAKEFEEAERRLAPPTAEGVRFYMPGMQMAPSVARKRCYRVDADGYLDSREATGALAPLYVTATESCPAYASETEPPVRPDDRPKTEPEGMSPAAKAALIIGGIVVVGGGLWLWQRRRP